MNILLLVVTVLMTTVLAILLFLCWYTIRLNLNQRSRSRHRADTPPDGISLAELAESGR